MSPIVGMNADGTRWLQTAHWGFVMPQVSKKTGNPVQPKAVNNARDDKLRTSRFWRKSFEERRCLIPATSFCEAKGRNPATYVWFGVKGEGARPPFALAGLWRAYKGNYGGGEEREMITNSMVTSTPNDLVRETHPDRMPVILDPADYAQWLTGTPDEAFALLKPFPADRMVIHQSGGGPEVGPRGAGHHVATLSVEGGMPKVVVAIIEKAGDDERDHCGHPDLNQSLKTPSPRGDQI